MISNIPTHEDFYKTGKELLVFSWDIVAKLLLNLDDAEYFGVDPEEVSEEYWSLASRQINTALAITQQGIEFLLKGRICEISPYLLISDTPSKWPSPYDYESIEFSKFRTLDAQDLIRVLDTFSDQKLDVSFVQKFNDLREKRNVIMHSLSTSLDVQFSEVIESLLYMHSTLFPSESWAKIRKEGLSNHPNSELGSSDFISNEICRELSIIIDLLTPAQAKKYFKIDKGRRAYFCPECHYEANHDVDFEFKLARLTSRDVSCSSLYCPVCDSVYEVSRNDCSEDKEVCPGNVISDTYSICLTCGH
ncbi:hypothetical protein MAQ5080_02209 [Marinomonas aquimarina]|uniref:Uncharacterized protein n=1 Tax=Marinomonas aquimarina TaxID=295068 RepID=A0A1A8TJ64_9GAMM|nr:hypothetical protein [Marinomonas aquimarina]SBS32258.1 hypothetical protein MAQ5080_02209 [Marinomonas aquimarina]